MNRLSRLSIRHKFLILFVTFIVPLLFFVASNIWSELEKQHTLVELKEELDEVQFMTKLIDEFQEERSLSQAYFSSEDDEYLRRLENQRQKTDRIIKEFETHVSETGNLYQWQNFLNDLSNHRQAVQFKNIDSNKIERYYSEIIRSILMDIENVAIGIQDPEVKSSLYSYFYLNNAKEYLSQARSEVTLGLANGELSRLEYGEFAIEQGAYETYLREFRSEASPELLEFYNENYQGEMVENTNEIITRLRSEAFIDNLNIDTEAWNEISQGAINRLRAVELENMTHLTDAISSKLNNTRWRVAIFIIFAIAIFAVAVILATYITRLITSSIYMIKIAADKLAKGETDVKLNVKADDELGDLAGSMNQLASNTDKLAEIAESIGHGDYSKDVSIKGEKDILGINLQKMKENLAELSLKEKRRNFLLSGTENLNNLVRGEKNLEEFSGKVLKHICNYLDLQVGAFYIKDDNHLFLKGSYGFEISDEDDDSSLVVQMGNGLVGQAAQDKEPVILENVPEEFFRIRSTFVNEKPGNIYIVPVLFENETIGVIELGSMWPLKKEQKDYINSISDKINILIVNLLADSKTNDLLQETQKQAEELEAQQEELRQTNDELKEQSMRLQASEEELKTSQEELQEKNAELEEKANQLEEQYEAIRGKNRELERVKEEIQEKMEQLELTGKYKSEFLANMSHELRTPLNSVLILAKLLAENKSNNLTEKQIEFANVIHKSGSDLLMLINEILDLSKIEAGKINLNIEEVDIEELMLETQFTELAKENEVRFNVQTAPNLPERITTDKFRIEQVIKNLLSNAFKFTDKGGEVTYSVSRPSEKKLKKLNIPVDKADRYIDFSVKDTGIGIPKEKQDMIFEAFQQADTSTSRKFGGTGLGLSISREIVNMLAGKIYLESKEEEGSTFSIIVPEKHPGKKTSETKAAATSRKVSVAATSGNGQNKRQAPDKAPETPQVTPSEKQILIIEDDKDFSKVLSDYAEDRGYDPVILHDGESGLEFLENHKPLGILLDIKLPGMNGWEFIEKAKSDPENKHIPIHVISATEEEEAAAELGEFSFLKKPVSSNDLESVFNKISILTKAPIKNILIVEDDKVQNRSIKELLESREMHTDSAYSGNDARKKIDANQYDCVILDLNLPDMDGLELLEAVKQDEKKKSIPFVVYSGKELSREEEDKIKRHTSAIIVKTGASYNRLLDEINLFLHSVQEKIPAEEKSETLRPLQTSKGTLNGKKVLLVDDDIRNIYALYNVLEEHGLEIETAGDGKEGLRKLQENPDTDLVLMDIMMPEMDGYEAIRHIRRSENIKNIPVIALTAKAMKGDREKTIAAGASDYISKPVDTEKLLSLMRVWLYDSNNV